MWNHWFRNPKVIIFTPLLLTLMLIIACGTAAPEPADSQSPAQPAAPTTAPTEVAEAVAAPTATAVPEAVAEPQAVVKPTGTLNIGLKETGPFQSHPKLTSAPQSVFLVLTGYETALAHTGPAGELEGRLAEEWSVSPDGLVWTFNLRKGIPFHKGYGEMTTEDFLWAMQTFGGDEAIFGRSTEVKSIWANEDGWVKAVDDYTIQVHTGKIRLFPDMMNTLRTPYAAGAWIVSKKQSDELGEEEASRNGAGTGPWEIVDHRSGEFWKFEAVEDHWRKTPEFAELILWEIVEESTRLANFQVGKLDTMTMSFDSLSAVEKVPGVKFIRQEAAAEENLTFYGNWYTEPRTGYDPELPWVSSNPDPSSPEWDRARKVRLAMILAIDRELIIKELLKGEAKPTLLWGLIRGGFEDRLRDPDMKWEYDPEQAKQLLAEAGYADGFEITLTPAIRNVPGEVEATEAIATMWGEVGIRAKLQKVPFSTLIPELIGRTYQGSTVHAFSTSHLEPWIVWNNVIKTEGRFNGGIEHAFLDERLKELAGTVDLEERVRIQKEVAR